MRSAVEDVPRVRPRQLGADLHLAGAEMAGREIEAVEAREEEEAEKVATQPASRRPHFRIRNHRVVVSPDPSSKLAQSPPQTDAPV